MAYNGRALELPTPAAQLDGPAAPAAYRVGCASRLIEPVRAGDRASAAVAGICSRRFLRLLLGGVALGAHERAVASAGFDEVVCLEFSIGARHCVGGDPEILCEPANRGQPGTGGERS